MKQDKGRENEVKREEGRVRESVSDREMREERKLEGRKVRPGNGTREKKNKESEWEWMIWKG